MTDADRGDSGATGTGAEEFAAKVARLLEKGYTYERIALHMGVPLAALWARLLDRSARSP